MNERKGRGCVIILLSPCRLEDGGRGLFSWFRHRFWKDLWRVSVGGRLDQIMCILTGAQRKEDGELVGIDHE